jgi:molecular chaperone DnaK (HSP70)
MTVFAWDKVKMDAAFYLSFVQAIGIDLGTEYTTAAVVRGEEAEIIPIETKRRMRSVVTFEPRIAGNQ